MRRSGWGWMLALLAGGVAGFAWLGADTTPGMHETPALTPAPGSAAPIAVARPVDLEPRAPDSTPATTPGIPVEARATPSTAVPAAHPDDAELERVGEALAREPALIDALEDATSHPDPVVRAEAEALVAEALERARARAAAPVTATP